MTRSTCWQAAIGVLLLATAACNGEDEAATMRGALVGGEQGGATYGGSGSGSGSGSDAGNGSGSDAGSGSGSGSDAGPDGPSGVDAGPDGGPPGDGAIDGGPGDGGTDGAIDGGDGDGGAGDGGTGDGGDGDGGAGDGGANDGGTGDGGNGDGGTNDGGDGDGGTGDGGTGDGGTGGPDGGCCGGPGPDAGGGGGGGLDPDDICAMLDSGDVDESEVSQETLDLCNGDDPPETSCVFSMVPAFYLADQGCNVYDPDGDGDLGNYGVTCPSDPYEQDHLCKFARQAWGPPRVQPGGEPWIPCIDEPCDFEGFAFDAEPMPEPAPSPAPTFFTANTFTFPAPPRAAVVIGSSMLSTHNQVRNGRMCSKASTAADPRGLRGNDFFASPGWRASWSIGLALARTGYASGDVIAAPGPDACNNPWGGPFPPARSGTAWLAAQGGIDKLMITDGGLINDLKSRGGQGWSATLGALVVCNAMERLETPINVFLAAEHYALNGGKNTVKVNRQVVDRVPPRVKFVRQMRADGIWAQALDVPAGLPEARCWFATFPGNGINPAQTIRVLDNAEMIVPPLIPLAPQVATNLTAIRDEYKQAGIKQIWLQYPYMDQANVVLSSNDLKLLWPVVSHVIGMRWPFRVTIPAVDPALRPRLRQVSDDLNSTMFAAIGCAGFAPAHPPQVCARTAANTPLVVVTQSAYAGWGPADHQTTIKGGMPHESAAGADKLGAGINAADALP